MKFDINQQVNQLKKVDWNNKNNILIYGLGSVALIFVLIWILKILIYGVILGIAIYFIYLIYKKKKMVEDKNGK